MEIVRGMCGGAYVCFSIGTLKNGHIDDAETISIDEDDYYFIYNVVVKHYPSFDLYDLVNPISTNILRSIVLDLEDVLEWMKTGVLQKSVSYYAEWLSTEKTVPAMDVLIAFFEELVQYLQSLRQYNFDYLNLEGI